MNILVVDDEIDLVEILTDELADIGYQTQGTSDPKEVVSILQGNQKIDLVISDVRMPVLDGKKLLAEVREKIDNPPDFIFITGFSDYSKESLIEAGALNVFIKPCDVDQMVSWIEGDYAERKAS